MNAPPESQPKVVELEVMPPITGAKSAREATAPIHPLSAIALLLIDNLWMLEEFVVIDWVVTIPLCFLTVFFPVFLIQKFVKKDSVGRAFGFATLLAVIAAVPTSLTGTPIGLALLAWTGLAKLFPKMPGKLGSR